jgi:glycosyltransferase involved in cell wall biosynthesis
MAPLRLWHIVELYPPHYGGGAAIYAGDICRHLARRGHEVRVLCTESSADRPAYTLRTELHDGVVIDRLNLPYIRDRDPGGWLMGFRAWRRHEQRIKDLFEHVLRAWSPDLVHFHTPNSLFEEGRAAVERRGLPVVGLAHCAWLVCPRLNLVRSPTTAACAGPGVAKCLECLYSHWDGSHARAAVKLPWRMLKLGIYPAYRLWTRDRTRKATHAMITYSKYMTTIHQRALPGPSVHIPLGIDLAGRPEPRPDRPRDPVRFGFAGGVQGHKGTWDILATAASLKAQGLRFEIHIWGPNLELARGPIADLSLGDRVFLRGLFAAAEKWSVYGDMDVHLMATQVCETFGRVVQEAAAMRTPSIAPDVGGISEQIRDGVDGLLYPFRDRSGLERQMRRVIENPRVISDLARNLWTVVDTCDAVGEVERLYQVLLESRSSSRTSVQK